MKYKDPVLSAHGLRIDSAGSGSIFSLWWVMVPVLGVRENLTSANRSRMLLLIRTFTRDLITIPKS